ncbi:MAG: TIGR03663 family protein [Planctomycetaceae bacterium]|nr:TIGR03663 family protein [Planctomycetaceae bacterium]
MKLKALGILLWAVVLAGGFLLRTVGLNDRPMHTDESVHAIKFQQLLEENRYQYDPQEFHGPTLNFLTLASAFMRGERTFSQVEEKTLRLVPAVFGTLLILTPLFFARGLGREAVFFSGALLAFSPAFVYYSRYYIQETLLVFFTACFLGSAWQYCRTRKWIWVVLSGGFLGLMHASKETFVLAVAAAAGLSLVWVLWRYPIKRSVRLSHLAAGLAAFIVVSCAFFSSFGANPRGIIDSVGSYAVWFQRAGGQSVHAHPWYYYLDLLTWLEFVEPLSWNEDGIVALALIGMVFLLWPKPARPNALACFLAVYTLLLTVIYSAIPYKTPWCMLSFLFGMVLVAGWMSDRLLRLARGVAVKVIFAGVLLLYGLVSPLVQSKLLAFDYAADPGNPYVYAHTSPDVFRMVEEVNKAALSTTEGKAAAIQVIAPDNDYWPLPWYLRDFSNVGYWDSVDAGVTSAPIILAQGSLEQELLRKLYSAPPPGQRPLYFPLFEDGCLLRPGIVWQGYVRADVWDRMHENTPAPEKTIENGTALMKIQPGGSEIAGLLKFNHTAMNTTFAIFMQHQDAAYAAAAARAAFETADRLESLLSRFIENSDISRVNAAAGQSAIVDPETMQCLIKAQDAFEITKGAFDIAAGSRAIDPNAFQSVVQLVPGSLEVRLTDPSARLDLGGIGKGYAADRMAQVLTEWSISKWLISAGASSVIAGQQPDGRKGWPITLSEPESGKVRLRLELTNEAIASSGIGKGLHIIDPATGRPIKDRTASWVRLTHDAAMADALSTAAMIMPIAELKKLSANVDGCSMMLLTNKDGKAEWIVFGSRFNKRP